MRRGIGASCTEISFLTMPGSRQRRTANASAVSYASNPARISCQRHAGAVGISISVISPLVP